MPEKIISDTHITARYQETDQMGVIHHSVYPIWFEVGRTDLIKKVGMTYSELERIGVMLPLIELTCAYKSFARYEDELIVRTCLDELSYSRISFYYEVLRADNENALIAVGKTFHIFTNASLKPVNMKKYEPAVYETLGKCIRLTRDRID